ncbi:aldo/keto reductase [Thaumasiovibrio sp. DFM-14]|uniref:aldo/keto reductase n=1 Tax=Thaumasiovibrio sp. DFM-14 TaxID=3384792 RepID=UPI0039A03086
MTEIVLPSGNIMPTFGLGTWYMGESRRTKQQEVNALRCGIEHGARLIDCAEMYAEGGAEEVVGEAIKGVREQLYIVSKVYPHNAGRKQIIQACENSLKRMKTDVLDLYLLHWCGRVPFEETLAGFHTLKEQGKIRDFGVSNLDMNELLEWESTDIEGLTATNQVLYNLQRREAEWAVLPFCQQRNMAMMAYCPLAQGDLLFDPTLTEIALRHNATPAQIALAWLLRQPNVVAIPKSSDLVRTKENIEAQQIVLDADDLNQLDHAFPSPTSAREARLGMV